MMEYNLCKDNIICCDDNCQRCASLIYNEYMKLKNVNAFDSRKTADFLSTDVVVKCKDCKNRAKGQDRGYTVYCERFRQMMDKTDFCSYGERKE